MNGYLPRLKGRGKGRVTWEVVDVALGSGGYLRFQTTLAAAKESRPNFGYSVISA